MAEPCSEYRFDIDVDQLRLAARLTPGQRVQAMLDAHEVVLGLTRGRLQRHYTRLSSRELNLKLLEELERAERALRRP